MVAVKNSGIPYFVGSKPRKEDSLRCQSATFDGAKIERLFETTKCKNLLKPQ
nr:MAG TPA: hypothetical protein [Bacteriophage sp.]